MPGIMREVFGGAALPIVQLVVLTTVGYLASYVVSAFGHGQVAGLIRLLTTLLSFGIIVGVISKTLGQLFALFGY